MTKVDFRHQARLALERAQALLAIGEAAQLRYAALELRTAMEALTYDRAEAFAAELPPRSYDTWQPRKLLRLLLNIDPLADKDSTLSFAPEDEYGVQPTAMKVLGTEKVLNLTVLKAHYDALGSHLHMPTIKQLESDSNWPDTSKLTNRCRDVAEFIVRVLASPVFNVTLGSFAETLCAKCGAPIRKRMPPGVSCLEVSCFECPASYILEDAGQGQVVWKPRQQKLRCQLPGCDTSIVVWPRELESGRRWTCPKCSSKNVICLGVALADQTADEQQKPG